MWSGCTSCTKCHPLFPEREHCMATLFSRKAYCQLNDGDPPKDIMFLIVYIPLHALKYVQYIQLFREVLTFDVRE